MHILADEENPHRCAVCAEQGRTRWTRRLYGPNNTPLCYFCAAERIRGAAARASRHQADPAVDAWEPGRKAGRP
jgi:hypothetical protein